MYLRSGGIMGLFIYGLIACVLIFNLSCNSDNGGKAASFGIEQPIVVTSLERIPISVASLSARADLKLEDKIDFGENLAPGLELETIANCVGPSSGDRPSSLTTRRPLLRHIEIYKLLPRQVFFTSSAEDELNREDAIHLSCHFNFRAIAPDGRFHRFEMRMQRLKDKGSAIQSFLRQSTEIHDLRAANPSGSQAIQSRWMMPTVDEARFGEVWFSMNRLNVVSAELRCSTIDPESKAVGQDRILLSEFEWGLTRLETSRRRTILETCRIIASDRLGVVAVSPYFKVKSKLPVVITEEYQFNPNQIALNFNVRVVGQELVLKRYRLRNSSTTTPVRIRIPKEFVPNFRFVDEVGRFSSWFGGKGRMLVNDRPFDGSVIELQPNEVVKIELFHQFHHECITYPPHGCGIAYLHELNSAPIELLDGNGEGQKYATIPLFSSNDEFLFSPSTQSFSGMRSCGSADAIRQMRWAAREQSGVLSDCRRAR